LFTKEWIGRRWDICGARSACKEEIAQLQDILELGGMRFCYIVVLYKVIVELYMKRAAPDPGQPRT